MLKFKKWQAKLIVKTVRWIIILLLGMGSCQPQKNDSQTFQKRIIQDEFKMKVIKPDSTQIEVEWKHKETIFVR